MLSIITNRFLFLKKQEIWFYNGESIKEEAYNSFCYACPNFSLSFESELKEFTATIDLTCEKKEIFDAVNTTFRYHIRKAEKSGFTFYNINEPSFNDCKKVIYLFGQFAKKRKIPPINKKRIFSLQKSGNLIITSAKKENSEVVIHLYLFDKTKVLLLHSFHDINYLDKQTRSYANKFLHWNDILLFKGKGLKIYDFGGINKTNVPGITNFKLSYGGEIQQVNSYTRVTPFIKPIFKLFKLIRPRGNKN